MNALTSVAKIRDKHRKGLLSHWAFQRLTDGLGRLGVTAHLSVIYREGGEDRPMAPGLPDCQVGFAHREDLPAVAAVERYPLPLEDLVEAPKGGRSAGGRKRRMTGATNAARLRNRPASRASPFNAVWRDRTGVRCGRRSRKP